MKLKPEYHKLSPEARLHHLEVPLIGLTGGIASGKSTVASLLRSKGLPVIDADQLVKKIYGRSEAYEFIKERYPQALLGGKIDFSILRKLVFENPLNKSEIEKFIYARLPEVFLESYSELGRPEFVIYDVPLLFEKQLDQKVDVSVVVYAPRKTQVARLMKRDGHLEEMAENILDHQMNIEEKKRKADFVIDNSQTEAELAAEMKLFLQQLFT